MPATQAERVLAGRIGAHTRWAQTADRRAAMAPAHAGLRAKFEREVDPDGVLSAAERARRADAAWKAHFARLALASSKARRARKAADGALPAAA